VDWCWIDPLSGAGGVTDTEWRVLGAFCGIILALVLLAMMVSHKRETQKGLTKNKTGFTKFFKKVYNLTCL